MMTDAFIPDPFGSIFYPIPVFSIIFFLIFFGILGFIAYTLFKGAKLERKNNHSPKLTVNATIVTKRIQVRGDHSHTTYYATFEVESGDRMELQIPHNQYGYLVEGDYGRVTFQGTRYIGFERS